MGLKLNTDTIPSGYTADLTGGQVCIASSYFGSGYEKEKAFDNDESTIWYATGDINQYVGVDFGSGVTKKIVRLNFRSARINSFTFDGSNDNSSWTNIYTGNRTNSSDFQTFDFTNANGYRYYRIRCNGALYSGSNVDVIEAEMMELEFSFLESGSAVYGPFDLSSIDEYDTSLIDWTATTPANTTLAVKTAVRNDSTTPAPEEYQAATDEQAIPNFTASQDLSTARLWIKVEMSTTDTTVSPELTVLSWVVSAAIDPNKIQIVLTGAGRMKYPQGVVTITYDKETGNLVGTGNVQVEDFTVTFTPNGITPVFNPHDVERISLNVTATTDRKRIYYVDTKTEEYIELTVTATAIRYHINDLEN